MTAPLVLDRLHIEASSRSRAETGYTIHADHKKSWLNHDLPLPLFRSLLTDIGAVGEIRFQGWGDPLANPDILPMIAAACATKARVVVVTDAGRFTDEHANALVRDGVAEVLFPLAGLTEETNFRRRGTSLYAVLDAVRHLRTVRAVHEATVPRIGVRYTLTRSGLISECEALPEFLAHSGIEQARLRPLSYATSPVTEHDTLVPDTPEEYDRLVARLTRLASQAKERGIALDSRVVHGGQTRFHCPDTPGSALFVAADGSVSPCPFRGVPVTPPAGYRFHGQDLPFPHDVRGNLHIESLAAIWSTPAYQDFRFLHDTDTPPEGCAGCWRSFLATVTV
jgi:MoaA/NifB/PqqE/SkfB family radical SAM enzyme